MPGVVHPATSRKHAVVTPTNPLAKNLLQCRVILKFRLDAARSKDGWHLAWIESV